MKVEINIKKMQDEDSHWYWIPVSMVEEFCRESDYICGKSYEDAEDEIEDFIYKYERFRTHGDSDSVPNFYI